MTAIKLTNGERITGGVGSLSRRQYFTFLLTMSQQFVEASYEGDLLFAAGVSTVVGRESRDTYNESLAGIRDQTTYRQIDKDVDPYVIAGDSKSGLLYGISDEPFGRPGEGDQHLQSYSYRVPLTDDPQNRISLHKPVGYDSSHYELHRRFFQAGGEFYMPSKKVPNEKTDLIGSEAALATDLLGMNDRWPVASYAERERILEETTLFTQGLLYFIANDPTVPVRGLPVR